MPMVPSVLEQALNNADLSAQAGAMSPEAEARVRLRNQQIALAVVALIQSADVHVTVTGQTAAGQMVVGTGGGVPGPVTASTTTPGSVTGVGVGKLT